MTTMTAKTSNGSKSKRTRRRLSDAQMRAGGEYRRFMRLSAAQRDAEVAQYGREMPEPDGKPLTAADKRLYQRAAARGAKVGRPVVGKGAKIVPVTIERGLLAKADAYAKREGLKRSQMVAQGLRLVMQQKKRRNAG